MPSDGTRRPRWWAYALLGWFVGALVGSILLSPWSGRRQVPIEGLALGQVGLWVGLVGAPIAASRWAGTGSVRRDFGLSVRPGDAVYALVGVAAQVVVVPLLDLFASRHDIEKPVHKITDPVHGAGFVVLALVVVVGVPIVEELFFRGLLLRGIQRDLNVPAAIVLSAVAFGLAHYELVQLPALIVLGLALGWLAVRTGRLGPSIWAHAAFNGLAILAVALQR